MLLLLQPLLDVQTTTHCVATLLTTPTCWHSTCEAPNHNEHGALGTDSARTQLFVGWF